MRPDRSPSRGSSEERFLEQSREKTAFALAGLVAAGLVVAIGTAWAYTRPSNDFSVFYAAWSLVLRGNGAGIYHSTPDRFLYAPGFAWIFSWLALLPRPEALAIWCLGKVVAIGLVVREFGSSGPDFHAKASPARRVRGASRVRVGLAAWGVVLLGRPVLIDLQYGQVNLLILGACAWAMSRLLRAGAGGCWRDGLSWALLGIAAVGKLFPLPLALVPFLGPRSGLSAPPSRLRWSRAGVVLGILAAFLTPVCTQGFQGAWALLLDWRAALINRGLPLESHNQSFMAFLYHGFSGLPTEIIAEHRRQLQLGFPLFSSRTIELLSLSWMAILSGIILALIVRGPRRSDGVGWIAALIGLLVLPSHLVWKPYFVLGLPLACIAVVRAGGRGGRIAWLLFLFAAINLSGFDLLGQEFGARMEAASILLWAHLGLFWAALRR